MIPFKIGNWLIDEKGIRHENHKDYQIDLNRLLERGPSDRKNMFDWLVHLPTKAWCSKEDIFALNSAFLYAIETFELECPDDISFAKTMIEQSRIMNRNFYESKE